MNKKKSPGAKNVQHALTHARHLTTVGGTFIRSSIVIVQERLGRGSTPRLSVAEQTFFAKRLAFLITAGIPILESLYMLREQSGSRAYARVMDAVIDDVANGQNLSKSLSKFPDMFGEFAINIIKVGETSGILSQNLEYLANELNKKQALRRKVIGALAYPALITLATLGITAFLMVYLFPKIMPVFLSLHMQLPLSTRIVIWLSTFLQHWGLLVILLIIAAIIVFFVMRKRSQRFRERVDRNLLRIPAIGSMIRYYNLANFTRTLGLLLKSGLTFGNALIIVADTSSNTVYAAHARALEHTVMRGEAISPYLAMQSLAFPDILAQMVAVGERTGNLSNTLVYLSEFYEKEMDDFTKNISTLIEPALMICMGLLIGFIAISIITPIYGITQNLHP